jgi:hypothetical protein
MTPEAARAEAVRAAFRGQAAVCAEMGSPFTARLCALVADRLAPDTAPIAARILDWPGEPSNRADALPLRLAGALHALVLEGRDAGLAAVYPPNEAGDDALWTAVTAALAATTPPSPPASPTRRRPTRPSAAPPSPPATSPSPPRPACPSSSPRSAPAPASTSPGTASPTPSAPRAGASPPPRPPRPRLGGPPPPLPPARVRERAGCDLRPLDLADPATETRLLSFVWADQAERLARARAAIALARAEGIAVEAADAADWLAARLAAPHPGAAHVVYHSIMWQYLPAATQSRIAGLIEAAGARATAAAPLAWLRLEGDGAQPGAALTLTLWPGGRPRLLARADFHGRWVRWLSG